METTILNSLTPTNYPKWLISSPQQLSHHQQLLFPQLTIEEYTSIIDFCVYIISLITKPYPLLVRLTSTIYIRRYFFTFKPTTNNNKIITLSDLILESATAVYLAGKVEELPPPSFSKEFTSSNKNLPYYDLRQRGIHVEYMCNQLMEYFPGQFSSSNQLVTRVVQHEGEFMEILQFDLWCYHPLRPAKYLMMLLAKEETTLATTTDTELMLNNKIQEFILNIYDFNNLILIWPHAMIGTAIVMLALRSNLSSQAEEKIINYALRFVPQIDQHNKVKDDIAKLIHEIELQLKKSLHVMDMKQCKLLLSKIEQPNSTTTNDNNNNNNNNTTIQIKRIKIQ
jgi:hypothetical protein